MPTKVHLVKVMVFPVVLYGCESWTIKKSEHTDLVHWEDLEGSGGEGGGRGDRMGNTCKPMAVSFQCMTKSTTIKKIKKKRKLKKKKEI